MTEDAARLRCARKHTPYAVVCSTEGHRKEQKGTVENRLSETKLLNKEAP